MGRPRSRSFQRSPKKRNLVWQLSSGSSLAQSAGVIALAFGASASEPVTVMRFRGEVIGFIDGTAAPGSLVRLTWGIIRVPEGSAATARYEPVSDANAPWLAYGQFHLGYEEMVTDVVDIQTISGGRHVVDSKAMRKMPPDTELQIVFENTTVGGARAFNAAYGIRWLQALY